MKKTFLSFAVLLMAAASCVTFTSCDDDNDDNNTPKEVAVSNGAFIIGSGNKSGQISGNVTSYDYASQTSTLNAFAAANSRNLGLTANDAVVYGDKMYIMVSEENTVEVVNKNTLKSIKQIKLTDKAYLGETNGVKPRHGVAYDGKVYVTTYGGYVAAIDTVTYNMGASYAVGSYPEGIAEANGKLYVANSDYGNGKNPSIFIIDVKAATVTDYKNSLLKNPVGIITVNGVPYILDSGSYDASWNQVGAGVYKLEGNVVTKVIDATMMAAAGNLIYVVNAPYGASTVTYDVYDITTGTKKTFLTEGVFSPAAIAVDPVNGNVLIASYSKNPDTGKANYKGNGYMNIYNKEGQLKKENITIGVGPSAIVFNTGVTYAK